MHTRSETPAHPAMSASDVMTQVKRQMDFERQMNMDRACQK
jgi:hypothetical protein